MSKNSEKQRNRKEKQAENYLKELEEVFSKEEVSIIKTIFAAVKPSIGPDYYEDAINNCCKALIESKIEGKEFDSSIPVRETYKETKFSRTDLVPLKSISQLPRDMQTYSDEDKRDHEVMKHKIYLTFVNIEGIHEVIENCHLTNPDVARIVAQARADDWVEDMPYVINDSEKNKKNIIK